MKCKYCDVMEIHWPENYLKGMKPLEDDTNVEHNIERCQSIKNGGRKVLSKICECIKKNMGICMACGGATCSYLGCYIENHNCKNPRYFRV